MTSSTSSYSSNACVPAARCLQCSTSWRRTPDRKRHVDAILRIDVFEHGHAIPEQRVQVKLASPSLYRKHELVEELSFVAGCKGSSQPTEELKLCVGHSSVWTCSQRQAAGHRRRHAAAQ